MRWRGPDPTGSTTIATDSASGSPMTDTITARPALRKAPTGIPGLDEITHGGLPVGRPTLVCGGPGSGKTLLGISFLVNGATLYDEPGVLMSFEENAEELARDVASLGFDLAGLIEQRRLVVDYVHIDRSEIEETGEYDLEGLFVRLDHAVQSVQAKRVVLDTIESLFAGLQNETILRAELRRLFRWLRDRGLTVVITGERGEVTLTRHGLEEYVSDAVIQLDHRVEDQISTRRIRVVKYRGSHHGTNEYPFLIDADGLSVLPVTSLTLQHGASSERVSSGLEKLDEMLAGRGTIAAARCWYQAPPARARRAWRRISPTRPAAVASGACISSSRSRRSRWCATCARPASTFSPGSTATFFSSTRTGRRGSGWKRTWWRCTVPSNSFGRMWWSSIP